VTKAGKGLIFKSLDTSHAYYVSASIRTILVERAGGGGSGSGIFRYRLLGAWSSLTANAEILDADGVSVTASATLKDPLSYMEDQTTNDIGHCYLEGEDYYTIQAPCTGSTPTGGGPSVPTINPTTYVPGTTI